MDMATLSCKFLNAAFKFNLAPFSLVSPALSGVFPVTFATTTKPNCPSSLHSTWASCLHSLEAVPMASRICFNSFSLAQFFFLRNKLSYLIFYSSLWPASLFICVLLCVRKRLLLFCDVSLCTWNFGQAIEIHPASILSITPMLTFSWVCCCDEMK